MDKAPMTDGTSIDNTKMLTLIAKCLLGAMAVLVIALLSKSKNFAIAGLVPLFPTFATDQRRNRVCLSLHQKRQQSFLRWHPQQTKIIRTSPP
jgi:hypothetical protein